MTEDELKKEAKEYAEGSAMYYESTHNGIPSQFEKYLRNAYIASAEPREKRIAELEQQIEKMKRCEICKHYRWNCCANEIRFIKDCIHNKMKHFELREIKENG